MSSVQDIDTEDDEFKERLAELARSDRDMAPAYRAYYERVYDEEVPST